ncbi:hypothetical protein FA13DRAFT_1760159 [Coprinellus micaceus]|uniref:CxC2-like cysteine cluster KDZ transposase-associated domain-containing protein n=1 Tax=Coprinellus micaceus TaxID=71717 RepID=A0A4Y7RBH2_COPMI|nr:hypothetical protein FA13DRAFT_1760159 [Coprinellus micaceus]
MRRSRQKRAVSPHLPIAALESGHPHSSGTPATTITFQTKPSRKRRKQESNQEPLRRPPMNPKSQDSPTVTVTIPLRSSATKSPNDYMQDWLPLRSEYLQIILDSQQQPPETCHNCRDQAITYRCLTCCTNNYLCWACCGECHDQHPLHRIEVWTGSHWEPSWLWRLGVCGILGHRGRRCPHAPSKNKRSSPPLLPPHNDTSYGASPEGRKLDGNSVLVCSCMGAEELHIQLLKAGFYPATSTETRTVFTFELLDLYLAETLECHTATHSFYSKLQRLTNESFPSSVPDRYRELLRVGRQWRNLKELMTPGEGDLALFCAACPQPGINLPDSWQLDPEQWVYTRVNVMDGNFICIHRMLKNQEGDMVWLKGNGEGFMTSKGPYDTYVENAVEDKEVSKCYNYRAIADRGKAYKGCDASGIGAAACGRHGAFIPTSVLDFQKGERQMNMDYCWTKSVQYGRMKDAPHLLYLYDINCQYPVNLNIRLKRYDCLEKPSLLDKTTWGIGTWHVHGHKESCLARFSPSFIPGAGRVGGEILESLWSRTNDIGRTSSIMTRAHRSEVLDANLNDSNTKKMQDLPNTLSDKLLSSAKELDEARADFDHLDSTASESQRKAWPALLQSALTQRKTNLKAMDIFTVHISKRMFSYVTSFLSKSRRAVQTRLINEENSKGGHARGVPKWLTLGIDIQQLQQQVIQFVRRCGDSPTEAHALDIATRRERILLRIQEHTNLAGSLFPLLNMDDLALISSPKTLCQCDGLEIPMPSTVRSLPQVWKTIQSREIELRTAQAHECLHKMRVEIGHKLFLFPIQHPLRGYAAVNNANRVINLYVANYNVARWSLLRLRAPEPTTSQLRILLPTHLRALPAIYDHKMRGERNKSASWIWSVDVAGDALAEPYLDELHRVTWLRARARLDRWEEEHILIKREMEWTSTYFNHKAKGRNQSPAQQAWARRCAATWRLRGVHASETFDVSRQKLNVDDVEDSENEASENEASENEASGDEASDDETSGDEASANEASENEASDGDSNDGDRSPHVGRRLWDPDMEEEWHPTGDISVQDQGETPPMSDVDEVSEA